MKKKVGRPKGSIKKVVVPDATDVTMAQIMLCHVDLVRQCNQLESTSNQLSSAFSDIIQQVNKANHELAKRIQAAESRCEELERLVVKNDREKDIKDSTLN